MPVALDLAGVLPPNTSVGFSCSSTLNKCLVISHFVPSLGEERVLRQWSWCSRPPSILIKGRLKGGQTTQPLSPLLMRIPERMLLQVQTEALGTFTKTVKTHCSDNE